MNPAETERLLRIADTLKALMREEVPAHLAIIDDGPIGQIETQVNRSIEALEARLQERLLFSVGPVVVFRWRNSPGWPVEYVSPNVVALTGHTAEMFLSRDAIYSDLIAPEDLPRVFQEVTTNSAAGVDWFVHEPYRLLRPTGETLWVADYSVIRRNHEGQITHYFGYLFDVTEQVGVSLDWASILKVSQAITSELVFDKLLTVLMKILLENAGARHGAIIIDVGGQLAVEMDSRVHDDRADKSQAPYTFPVGLADYRHASEEIIRHVAQTTEIVLLTDAVAEGPFRDTAYVVQNKPRSILCMPLLTRGRTLGVLYLENNVAAGAFTQQRVATLRTLSSQIASSLDNALLHRELEERVTQRTAELSQRNLELSDAMRNLRQAQDQLVQTEKLASMGRLTMGIAHELKNPLNFIVNYAKIQIDLADDLEQSVQHARVPKESATEINELVDHFKETSSGISEHGMRANDIIKSMMRHAAGVRGERQACNINNLLDQSIDLALNAPRVAKLGVHIRAERDYDETLGEMTIIPQDVSRAFINLIDNAIDAIVAKKQASKGDQVSMIYVRSRKDEAGVTLWIRDTGTGISPADKERIFEPFFTSKSPGLGIGLGLSLTYDIIVKGHRGTLTCESTEGEGTTFIIHLPN